MIELKLVFNALTMAITVFLIIWGLFLTGLNSVIASGIISLPGFLALFCLCFFELLGLSSF